MKTKEKTAPAKDAADEVKPTPAPARPAGTVRGPQRRRPVLIIGSIAAIVLSSLLAVWVWTTSTTSVEVLAARTTIQRGHVVQAADLVTVRVNLDPAMQSIPAAQLADVVGKVAALDVAQGSLLTQAAVAPIITPERGKAVVGIALEQGLLPATPLQTGDTVRIVQTPGAQGEPPTKDPWSLDAVVVSVTPSEDGQLTVVDVEVSTGDAARLAALTATGKVALILDARER